MGGKAWQSKGCQACRKRKVKCDEQKPQCKICLKRSGHCPGYERSDAGALFIYHAEGRKQRSSFQVESVNRPGDLARPAWRSQVFASYYDLYFPKGTEAVSLVDYWQFLIRGFAVLPNKSDMLERAIAALSCLYLGKMQGNNGLFFYGLQLYTVAIRMLLNAMYLGRYDNQIIYTAVLFQEIEKLHCPHDLQAYFAHVEGTDNILRHYRPKIVQNSLIDAIYINHTRLPMLLSSAGIKKPHERYVPVTQLRESTLQIKLIKIYDDFGSVIATINSITQPCPDLEAYQNLLGNCLEQKSNLIRWYTMSGIGVCHWHPVAGEIFSSPLPPMDSLFGKPYHFHSMDDATLYTWYWFMMIQNQNMIYKVKSLVGPLSQASPDLPFYEKNVCQLYEEHHRHLTIYADRACLSVAYLTQDKMGTFGLHAAMLPMFTVAHTYLALGIWDKFFWCQQFFQLCVDRGHHFATHHLNDLCSCFFKEKERRSRALAFSQDLSPRAAAFTKKT